MWLHAIWESVCSASSQSVAHTGMHRPLADNQADCSMHAMLLTAAQRMQRTGGLRAVQHVRNWQAVPISNRKEFPVRRLALMLIPLLIAGLMSCGKSGTVTGPPAAPAQWSRV